MKQVFSDQKYSDFKELVKYADLATCDLARSKVSIRFIGRLFLLISTARNQSTIK